MPYNPDTWVVLKIKGEDPHYRVLAGWVGGYLSGDSWRLNSGITRVEEDGEYFKFFGSSGSVYWCHKNAYGLRLNTLHIWNSLQKLHGETIELMDEMTDWSKVDWILND